jgi:hypothetical protein
MHFINIIKLTPVLLRSVNFLYLTTLLAAKIKQYSVGDVRGKDYDALEERY